MDNNIAFASETGDAGSAETRISLDHLEPCAGQVRKHFDEAELQGLAESIKARGVIQPIIVKPLPTAGRYEIVAGERRWRASRLAGVADIPAIIRHGLNDADTAVIHLVENLQRQDLTLAEQCAGARDLVKQVGLERAASELGKSVAWVSKRAGVLEMPAPIRQLVGEGKIGDVEMAGTLTQIHAIDPESAKRLVATIVKPQGWERPPTRESLRQELKQAEDRIKREAQRKRQEEQDKAQQEKNKAKDDKQAAKAKERERLMARVKEARKDLKVAALQSLKTSLSFSDKQMESWRAPIRIDYAQSDFSNCYDIATAKFPETAEACHYEFSGRGDIGTLQRMAEGFGKKPMIEVRCPDLTLEQAERLSAALKDVPDLALSFESKVNGKELNAIAARLQKVNAAAIASKSMGAATYAASITVGMKVRIKEGVKGPNGKFRKSVGRIGVVESCDRNLVHLRFGARPHEVLANVGRSEVEIVEDAPAEKQGELCIGRFLSECMDRSDPAAKTKASDVYSAYESWCEKNKLQPIAFTHNRWGESVASAGIDKHRHKTGYQYLGVRPSAEGG